MRFDVKKELLAFLVLVCLVQVPAAHAYIGPGLAASTLGVIIGVVVSILLAVFAIFWYPIKRFYKRLVSGKKDVADD